MTIRLRPGASVALAAADALIQADATPILELLSAGFEITSFHVGAPGIWLACVNPDEVVRSRFGLKVACLVIGNGKEVEFQQRTLSLGAPAGSGPIDPRIRFVASTDPLAEAGCAAWGAANRIGIVLLKNGLSAGASDEEATSQLYRTLSHYLWRNDLFDEPEPVRFDDEFFGRETAANEVLMRLMAGTAVAVFGLRKIGKSSLLGRVAALLESDTTSVTAVASLLGNSARLRNGRWWTAGLDMLSEWQDSLNRIAVGADSKIRVRANQLEEAVKKKIVDTGRLISALEKDVVTLVKSAQALRTAMGRDSSRLVLAIDECDQLYPHTIDAGHWRTDFFILWNALQSIKRGLDEPGALVFLLAGANPSGVEHGSLIEQPNPLFGTYTVYLGPMSRQDAGALLHGVGGRMGLVFSEGAVDCIFGAVGGHPLLLRRFGSVIHRAESQRSSPNTVSADVASQLFKKSKREFYNQVLWVLENLRRVAPDEERLLRDLVFGGAQAYQVMWKDNDLKETFAFNLERYGLVRFDGETPVVDAPLVRDALQKPSPSEFEEHKRQLKSLIDAIEAALRARLAVDIAKGKSVGEAVHIVVNAIPSDAKNRPLARQELIDLGESVGLAAVLEAMNWGDYEILLNVFHDAIEWNGPTIPKQERLATLKKTFVQAHLARHNNDRELRELINTEGFAALFSRFCVVRDMLAAGSEVTPPS